MKFVFMSEALVKEGLRHKLIGKDKNGDMWYGGAKVITHKAIYPKKVDVGEVEARLNLPRRGK